MRTGFKKFLNMRFKIFVFLGLMFLLISSFNGSFIKRHVSPIFNKEKQMCDVNILCSLIKLEEESQGLEAIEPACKKEIVLKRTFEKNSRISKEPARAGALNVKDEKYSDLKKPERKDLNNPAKGTIYLTGDFDRYTLPEIEEMVNLTLNEIGYDRIDEYVGNATIVTVINKQDPEENLDEVKVNSSEQIDTIMNLSKKQHELVKKIAEVSGLTNKRNHQVPLVVRHFENKSTGIKTMVVMVKNDPKCDLLLDQQGDREKNQYRENQDRLSQQVADKLNCLGPKLFLERSNEIK